jgi:hypothetical protein
MSVIELEKRVTELSSKEFDEFRTWFADYEMAQWDKQIKRDSTAGKLDHLIAEALEEHRAGRSTEI